MMTTATATTATSAPRAAKAPGASNDRSAGRSRASTIIVTGVLVLVALYFLVPIYWVVVAATKTSEDLFSTFGFWFAPNFALWDNLGQVLTYDDGIFVRWFLNSVLYAGVGAVLATYFAAAGGYALGKYRFRGNNLIFGLILGGVLAPGTATALPLFLLFSQMGLANTYWSVLIPSLVSPFGLFLCRIYAQATVDDALLEAARLDGAGELRIFHSVVLRILTPALGAEYAYFLYLLRGAEAFHKGRTTDFATVGVRAVDERTLVVSLAYPAPYFLQILLNSPWRPVHTRSIAAQGGITDRGTKWTLPGALVSSGPFVLKEWSINRRVVVEKSPTYWDQANVRLTAVHFYPTDNIDAEERAFRTGQLHVTWALPLSKVLPLEREKSPSLRIDPLLETYFLRLNVRRPPLDDVRIRRALALSIDRETLASRILPGGRRAAATFIPPLLVGYIPPERRAHDPEEARRLLAEAGHPRGAGLPPIELLYNNSDILRLVSEAVQQMWHRELGLEIRLVNQERKTVFASRRAGDYQAVLGSWTADYLDATTFLDMWRSDSGNNQTGWSDPAFDALCDRANTLVDPVARAAVLAEAERRVLDAAAVVPVYFNTHVYLLHPAVKGWQPTPMDHTDYRSVFLQP